MAAVVGSLLATRHSTRPAPNMARAFGCITFWRSQDRARLPAGEPRLGLARFPGSFVSAQRGFEEAAMARIVIRCQYTGHYVFTGIDTKKTPNVAGGKIFCPYCTADHVWSCPDVRHEEPKKKPLVRQAV